MLYFPVLRTKRAESEAITNLKEKAKAHVCPILVIPPPDVAILTENQQKAGTLTQAEKQETKDNSYVEGFGQYLQLMHLPTGQPCYVDALPADLSPAMLHRLLEQVKLSGVETCPVLYVHDSDNYWHSFSSIVGIPTRAMIRITREQTKQNDILRLIESTLVKYNLPPSKCILVIDMEDVSTDDTDGVARRIIPLLNDLGALSFTNTVLLSSGFPGSEVIAEPWKSYFVPRNDWDLWQAIAPRISYPISYGDYGPMQIKRGGDVRRSPAPKVRYTLPRKYFVVKGSRAGDDPEPDRDQYRKMAQRLYDLDDFPGSHFSWGDKQIFLMKDTLTYNQADVKKWISISLNHHIEQVVSTLLSNSDDPS